MLCCAEHFAAVQTRRACGLCSVVAVVSQVVFGAFEVIVIVFVEQMVEKQQGNAVIGTYPPLWMSERVEEP